MNTDVLLGLAFIAFGIYTTVARYVAPQQLGKVDAMKKMWGDKGGLLIHVLSYSVLPLVAGIIMLWKVFAG